MPAASWAHRFNVARLGESGDRGLMRVNVTLTRSFNVARLGESGDREVDALLERE